MKLQGLVAATYTPTLPDGSLNEEPVTAMFDWMIERGVAGFYVCGSTGEGPSLTEAERRRVAELSVSAASGRRPVVVQVGSGSLETAIALTHHAADIGADAISSLPPLYFKPHSVDQLVDAMTSVAAAAPDLPFYYYHIPRLSGVKLDMVEFLERGAKRIPNLAGIKFSDFDLAEFRSCQLAADGRFDILFGSDEMMLGALAMGGKGAVGSCYGFAAPLWLRIIEAFARGDMTAALQHQSDATRMVRFLASCPGGFQAAVKQVVWPELEFEIGALRAPQPTLSATEIERIQTAWRQSDFPALIQ